MTAALCQARGKITAELESFTCLIELQVCVPVCVQGVLCVHANAAVTNTHKLMLWELDVLCWIRNTQVRAPYMQ
jgi:hypothetical protein